MKVIVVYDSLHGNTEKIATAIRNGLADALGNSGSVTIASVGDVQLGELASMNLVVVGGPTHGSRPSQPMHDFLERIPAEMLGGGIAFAACDTRTDMDDLEGVMRFLGKIFDRFGYAAPRISATLEDKGRRPTKTPEGFIVEGMEGPLRVGALARAEAWARQIADLGGRSTVY